MVNQFLMEADSINGKLYGLMCAECPAEVVNDNDVVGLCQCCGSGMFYPVSGSEEFFIPVPVLYKKLGAKLTYFFLATYGFRSKF
jgi:hypothetical protein